MMSSGLLIFCIVVALCDAAFLSQKISPPHAFQRRSSTKPLHLFETTGDFMSSAASNLIATIDQDIASIPDNEFGTVFAGGLVVMAGGVVSALVVGFILESGDLYANAAAESYLQGADDEEFWKGLSEEERKKTEEVLEKIRASKEGRAVQPATPELVTEDGPVVATTSETTTKKPVKSESTQPADMFSDY